MNEAMKQRLVGVIVLGCLAIIFIPILLDGEGVPTPQIITDIPPAPALPTVPDIKPQRPEVTADSEAIRLPETPDQSNEAQTAPQTGERPSLNAEGIPEAWSVRLASFADEANARNLLNRLLDAGYKGYSRPLASSQGSLTGVFVGPVLTRSDAGKLQKELEEKYKLPGLIVEFSIDAPPNRENQ